MHEDEHLEMAYEDRFVSDMDNDDGPYRGMVIEEDEEPEVDRVVVVSEQNYINEIFGPCTEDEANTFVARYQESTTAHLNFLITFLRPLSDLEFPV